MIKTKLHIIILFIGFIMANYSYSQTFTFIYIDKNISNLDSLRRVATKLINNTSGDKLLFISNDKTPLISTNENDAIEALEQLGYIRPNTPNAIFEIDTLNNLLSNYIENHENFKFHFFLNPSQAISKKQIIILIERLLLCNNLLNNSNTRIGLHLEKSELNKKSNREYFRKIFYENEQYELDEY